MKFFITVILIFIALLSSCKSLQPQASDLLSEFTFTKGIEGPAVDQEGNLYAVNFKEEGTIGVVKDLEEAMLFVSLPEGSIGNGIRFNQQGDMFIADYMGHNVLRIKQGTTAVEVWAHNPEMNQPNDLAIAPNGNIYLSDPNWAEETGQLWQVNSSQKIILLEKNMGTTNGIAVSPDGKMLYVNESVQRKVWQYNIDTNGSISNKTLFYAFPDFGMDGMRFDQMGNLYIARYDKGTVVVLSPDKKIIKEVQLKGKKPSNITFGGKDGKTCYVTMADRGCFEVFKAENSGADWALISKTTP